MSRGQQRFAFHFHVCQCMDVFLNAETGQEVPWLVAGGLHPSRDPAAPRAALHRDGGRRYNSPFMFNVSLSLCCLSPRASPETPFGVFVSEPQLRKPGAAECDTPAVGCRARRGPRGCPTDQLCLTQPGVPARTSLMPWECAPGPAPTADTAPHLLRDTGNNTGILGTGEWHQGWDSPDDALGMCVCSSASPPVMSPSVS